MFHMYLTKFHCILLYGAETWPVMWETRKV